MALQIWLPLIEDFRNQGLSDLTFSPVASNTVIDSSGKIGSHCFYNNSYTAGGLISDKSISLGTNISMFCWMKFNGLMAASSLGGAMGGQHRYQTNSGMGITIKYLSESTGQLSLNTGNGSDRTYNAYTGNTTLYAGIWYHVGFTYDGSTIKLYVNGQLDGQHSYSGQYNPADYIGVFCWSLDGTSGRSLHANYKIYGFMNDFRIYDNVLTPKEIKILSQGLAAHWQLKGNGSTNFIVGSDKYTKDNPLSQHSLDSTATNDSYIYYDKGELEVIVPVAGTYSFVLNSDGVPSNHATSGTTASQRRFSMWLYNGSSHYCWGSYGTAANGEHYGQVTIPAGSFQIRINLYAADGVDYTVNFWNLRLIKGTYTANDTWIPNSNDDYNFISSDSSGYGHDGTKNGQVYESYDENARYQRVTEFSGSQYISCGRGPMVTDAITVSCWGYMSSWADYTNRRLISCTESGGWNIEPSGENSANGMCFAVGTGFSNDFAYRNAVSDIACSSLSAGWHMITGTYDGYTTKIYIDGVFRGSNTASSSKRPIYYNSTNGIFIGAEATGSVTSPGGQYFNGKISDVRIYGTALSAEDIKELYTTPASIDNTMQMYSRDFVDGRNINSKIKRNGITTTEGFSNKYKPVYDMETKALPDGSVWAKIHELDVSTNNTFFTTAEVAKCNTKPNRYSRMGVVDEFKSDNYEFMLTYPTIVGTLPNGYIPLEYIEATGTQWVNTGITGPARWEFDIQFTKTDVRKLMGYGGDGGEYWGCQANGRYGVFANNTMIEAGARDTIVHDFSGGTSGGNTLWADNTSISVGDDDVSSKQYQIFTIASSTGWACYAKLWRCKCIQNGSLVRDFVPAMRESDGYIGLYDRVNSVFYGNSGSGSFKAGGLSGYQWLNYLESSGTQYIDTGFNPNNNTRIVIRASLSGAYSIYGTNYSGAAFNMTGNSTAMYYYWGSAGASKQTNMFNAIHTFEQDKNVCKVDHEVYHTYTNATWQAPCSIYLFGRNSGSGLNDAGSTVRIYSCQIYDNGTLVRDFVPCINPNGVLGMFDRKNKVFYANAGSGSFVSGGVRSKPSPQIVKEPYLQGTGPQYINSGVTWSTYNMRIQGEFIYDASMGHSSIFGTQGSSTGGNCILRNASNQLVWYAFSQPITIYSSISVGQRVKFDLITTSTGKYYYKASLEGGTPTTGSGSITLPSTPYYDNNPIYIFDTQINGGRGSAAASTITCKGKLFYLKIWQNRKLVRDFVPYSRNTSTSKFESEAGLYDKVDNLHYPSDDPSNKFYYGTYPKKKNLEFYNRWIQTSSPNASSVTGFKPIVTSWPQHFSGLRKHGTSCVYNCDSGSTWYAPIGQTAIWEGGIPAANGTMQSQTELWVRIDRLADVSSSKIYQENITAKDFIEY